jgi:hypothetical protein
VTVSTLILQPYTIVLAFNAILLREWIYHDGHIAEHCFHFGYNTSNTWQLTQRTTEMQYRGKHLQCLFYWFGVGSTSKGIYACMKFILNVHNATLGKIWLDMLEWEGVLQWAYITTNVYVRSCMLGSDTKVCLAGEVIWQWHSKWNIELLYKSVARRWQTFARL